MEPNQVQQVVENPYSLKAMLLTGDAVSRTVFVILVIMSAMSWFIMFTKWLDQVRLNKQYQEVVKGFWSAGSIREGINRLKGKDHAFKMIAEDGLRATEHHEGRLTDQIPLHEWVTMSLQRSVDQVNSSLSKGLSFLATVGSTSPFVGLFGTVYGILKALTGIGAAGQASIDKVAGPVGEALIMTAIGLAVAVPAVLGYNWLLGRNKRLLELLRYFNADLHAFLVSGARVSQDAGGRAAASAPRAK
ncbi:MAG: MotA/TolQ/ExbB proton channel family protein [Steroidobacter sp.]